MAGQQLKQRDFYQIIESEDSCYNFLKHKGLLSVEVQKCVKVRNGIICDSELREYNRKDKGGVERLTLRCCKKGCQTYSSIRKSNAFFTFTDLNGRCNSKLKLSEIMELVWMWVNFVKNVTAIRQTGKATNTVCDWYNLCRDVCVRMFEKRKPMGGAGQIVQIDESLFQGKRKYHRGRYLRGDVPVPDPDADSSDDEDGIPEEENPSRNYGKRVQGPWIFGLSWKRVDGVLERRFFKVENRKKSTLLPIILNEVSQGTTIHSDGWKAYRCISSNGFIHETVNHSVEFVDSVTGAHTQTIECLWGHAKRKYNIKVNGAGNLLERKLIEEWWRSCNANNVFESFLRDMKVVFCE